MTIAMWCILAAGALPIAWIGYAKVTGGRYDNAAPRVFLAGTQGAAQRAHWAEQNSHEAFPLFAAAVIVAQLAGADQASADALAVVFVLARIAHGVCYIADQSTLRSLVWAVGWGCSLGLFLIAA